MSKVPLHKIPKQYTKPDSDELEFDIRDVQNPNPRRVGKTPTSMYRTDHKIPRKYRVKKKWWQ